MSRRSLSRSVGLVVFALGVPSASGLAASSSTETLFNKHVLITEVAVDSAAETITITGRDFDFGGAPRVKLGEIGEVSSLCSASYGSPDTVVCDFSGAGLPPDGDYLLTLVDRAGREQDGFVRPDYRGDWSHRSGRASGTSGGPPGADGAPGAPGPPGPSGVATIYTRTAVATAIGTGDVETIGATALCDPGDPVLGGGFTHQLTAGGHSMPQNITNAPNGAGTGWVGLMQRIMPAGSTLTVAARCADVTP